MIRIDDSTGNVSEEPKLALSPGLVKFLTTKLKVEDALTNARNYNNKKDIATARSYRRTAIYRLKVFTVSLDNNTREKYSPLISLVQDEIDKVVISS